MESGFVAWLEGLRTDVAAARASKQKQESGTKQDVRPDKRLVHRLPIQFEHDGELRWAFTAYRATFWSAIWQLGFYVCWLVAIVAVLARRWMPDWLWPALVLVFAVTWCMGRLYRRRERPAERWRAEAEVVPGAVVYANDVLWQPGPEPASNAGFVFTFDPDLAGDPARLVELAEQIAALTERESPPSADLAVLHRRAREWTEDRTEANPHRFDRVQVPPSWSGNDQTFMTMVAVNRGDLLGGVIDRRIYPLLARRDHDESADILPLSFWGESAA